MTGSNRLLLTGILVFALALRVGVAFAWQPALAGDAEDYHRLTSGLAAGRGYVNTLGAANCLAPSRISSLPGRGVRCRGRRSSCGGAHPGGRGHGEPWQLYLP